MGHLCHEYPSKEIGPNVGTKVRDRGAKAEAEEAFEEDLGAW